MGRFGRVLSVLAVACALLAAYNVYADASGLDGIARLKACDDNQKTCRPRLARVRRSPISHVYVLTWEAPTCKLNARVRTRCWVRTPARANPAFGWAGPGNRRRRRIFRNAKNQLTVSRPLYN